MLCPKHKLRRHELNIINDPWISFQDSKYQIHYSYDLIQFSLYFLYFETLRIKSNPQKSTLTHLLRYRESYQLNCSCTIECNLAQVLLYRQERFIIQIFYYRIIEIVLSSFLERLAGLNNICWFLKTTRRPFFIWSIVAYILECEGVMEFWYVLKPPKYYIILFRCLLTYFLSNHIEFPKILVNFR